VSSNKGAARLQYIDWVRGLAAIIMLQGHVFHSFLRTDLRSEGPYVLSQFVGGMPPAIFLFLTGVTLAFLMSSSERKGLSAGEKVWAVMRRSGYLFALAFAFRIQMWVFGGMQNPWTDLFKVDILNSMGFAILLMSLLSVFRARDRIRFGAISGVAIAAAAPVVSMIDWSWMPWMLRDYFIPNYNYFAFFPWAAFLAFGLSGGTILRRLPHDDTDRAMQWTAILGGALVLTGQYFSNLPYSIYPRSEFWLNSPGLIFIKLGVILLIMAFAYLWSQYLSGEGWSWVRQFGTTSLLVYWVHTELVYGWWFYFWKENLGVGQTVFAAIAVILVMLGLSVARTNWPGWRTALSGWNWTMAGSPRRVSGD
jgi:uncharacterized membrane protein